MYRWKVVRGWVMHRKIVYAAGELMPESFTDRDRAHNIYSRRLQKVEIPSEPTGISEVIPPTVEKAVLEVPVEVVEEVAAAVEVVEAIKEDNSKDIVGKKPWSTPTISEVTSGVKKLVIGK